MKYQQQAILSHGSLQLDIVNHLYIHRLKTEKTKNRSLWDLHADDPGDFLPFP